MKNRWTVLALLFAVRSVMAFQYQSTAAVSPLLMERYGVDLADIGLLIGLYLAPGIVLALPGGKLGALIGDKRCVLIGLALMTSGGTMMTLAETWDWQVAGRAIAGIGGVLLNVVMSKMVTDWFAGREIATAMAIFVNSWPLGIALALLVLAPIALATGLTAVFALCTGLVALGFVALWRCYQEPGTLADTSRDVPSGPVTVAVIASGFAWSFYNSAFAMVFGFGPLMLVQSGWTLSEAGSVVSLALWLVTLSVPAGGFIADYVRRPLTTIIIGCLVFACLMFAVTREGHTLALFAAIGLVGGIPAGAIMSLPSRVLDAPTRAVGMGIFFTVFYIGMVAGPYIGGLLATRLGHAAATFDLGALLLLLTGPCIWLFTRWAKTPAPAAR
jgi:MFS family permease